MSKYLLTGGSGTLGLELQKYLDCWAPDRSVLDVTWSPQEIIEELPGHFDARQYDGIIHCAAYTDVSNAEIDKKTAVEINILGTKNVVDFARILNLPVYHISTDYVYEGSVGNYSETAKTGLINFYSATKVMAETFLDLEKDLVVRVSFKPDDLWINKYKGGFIDIYTSADYVNIIAPDIAFAIHSKLKGVYNIGTERKSIYDLAKQSNPDVEELDSYEVSYLVKLPKDISMDVSKYLKFKTQHINKFEKFISKNRDQLQ